MDRTTVFLIFLVFAGLYFAPTDAGLGFLSSFTDRSAMEAFLGYSLADVYFNLLGTGTPGNYYDLGYNYLWYGYAANFPEVLNWNFYSAQLTDLYRSYNGPLLTYGTNQFLTEPYIGIGLDSYGSYSPAFGLYLETGPLQGPALNEPARLTSYDNESGSLQFDSTLPLSEGDFFGLVSQFQANELHNLYFNWDTTWYSALSHVVLPPQYVIAGGDPHLMALGIKSEMDHVRAGERFALIDHPSVRLTAEVREFDFLPASMHENNFFGTMAFEMANGDRVVVHAFEDDEGKPTALVLLNGIEFELGSAIADRGYELSYTPFSETSFMRGRSAFADALPYMEHNAIVRVEVPHAIVIDVAVSSKPAFADYNKGEVIHSPGAFLNVNMRDLVLPSVTQGMLRRVQEAHAGAFKVRQRIAALEEELSTKADLPADHPALASAANALASLRHRQDSIDVGSQVAEIVASHKVDELF